MVIKKQKEEIYEGDGLRLGDYIWWQFQGVFTQRCIQIHYEAYIKYIQLFCMSVKPELKKNNKQGGEMLIHWKSQNIAQRNERVHR